MNKNLRNAIKAFMLLVCFSFFQNETQAQTFENGIFFQALARDNYANPAKDRKIYVQSTIIQSTINGTNVLVEEYQTTTDATGVFGISIGKGTRTGGSLSALNNIDWSAGPYFLNLKISITPVAPLESWNYSKDWIDLGTTSFGTVPYALYAKSVAGFDTKLNVSDTTKMLLPYAKSQALTLVQNSLSTKLNTADSVVKYVTPAQLASNKFDTTTLSNRIDLKANASNLATVATTGSFNDLTNIPTNYVSTVGNISGSSNANGAIITSGALNLTPADATNGGIVTTGGQFLAGEKTFKDNITVHYGTDGTTAIRVGVPNGSGALNTMLGTASYLYGTPGDYNTAIGGYTLSMLDGGSNNTAVGVNALRQSANSVYNGNRNTAVGSAALSNGLSSSDNVAVGVAAIRQTTGNFNSAVGNNSQRNASSGSNNTSIGYNSLYANTIGSNNTAIGNAADVAANNLTNATAIGNGAIVSASNSVQLGNASVSNVKTNGTITAGAITYPNTTGSNGQILTTNGSGVASWVDATGITVGTISNTSNVNGATVTSGILRLTPADVTNGGIVTSGTQSFSGNKTFVGNIIAQPSLTTGVLDINANNPTSPVNAPDLVGRQTFTPGISGYLTSVKLLLYSTGTYTLKVYQGGNIMNQNSPGGTLLYQTTFSSVNNILSTIPISNLQVVSGTQYWFELSGAQFSAALNWGRTNVGSTVSFPAYYGGLTYSWIFQTYVSQLTGGNITSSGTITAGTGTSSIAGTLVVGSASPSGSSAALEVKSTSQGLLLPRLTTAQRDAIGAAESGLLIYNTTTNKFQGYASSSSILASQTNSANNGYLSLGSFEMMGSVNTTTGSQVFTVNSSNSISSIDVYFSGAGQPGNVTLTIFSGSTIGSGTNLGSTTLLINSTGAKSFVFGSPISVQAGSYYFLLTPALNTNLGLDYQNANFSGGSSYQNSNLMNNTSYRFVINAQSGGWSDLN